MYFLYLPYCSSVNLIDSCTVALHRFTSSQESRWDRRRRLPSVDVGANLSFAATRLQSRCCPSPRLLAPYLPAMDGDSDVVAVMDALALATTGTGAGGA